MISGQYGTAKGGTAVILIEGWTFDEKALIHKKGHNQSGGYKDAVAGVKDGNGTLKGPVPDTGIPPLEAGDSVTLSLYTTASAFYSVPALIASVKTEVDLNDGNIVGYDASFETVGEWTRPT